MKIIAKKSKNKFINILKYFGPGFITGSADDDPSGIGTYSLAGAKYGLLLAWLVPFQLPLMYAIQEMCARIAITTKKGLTANMEQILPKSFLNIIISIFVFANIFNIGADLAIMSSSLRLITGGNIIFLSIIIAIIIIITEIRAPYRIYSKVLLLSSSALLAYIITAFMTTHDWINVFKFTFIPHIKFNRDFILIMTGFIGTTISPYLFFWQSSQEIEDGEENKEFSRFKSRKNLIYKSRSATFFGSLFSQLMALFVLITCYSSLHLNGIFEINSAYDAALALKPLAGEWAFLLFTIGIIGSGFLGIPVLSGSIAYSIAEIQKQKKGLNYKFHQAKFFYYIIAASTFAGIFINIIGINPIKALLYSAIINCIVSVPIIAIVIAIANNKKIMGQNKNKKLANFFAILTFIIISISSILTLIYL